LATYFEIMNFSSSSHCVVGSASGDMYRVDLRQKGLINGHYKGAKGSIREVACVDNYVLSVSLDRFFRVHAADSRKLLKSVGFAKYQVFYLFQIVFFVFQEYLKSKLSCLLIRSNFKFHDQVEEAVTEEDGEIKVEPAETEMDEIFGEMEEIEEQPKKRVKITVIDVEPKKKRKSRI